MKPYYYCSAFSKDGGFWRIIRSEDDAVVFEMPHLDEHFGQDEPPPELRAEYERLIGYVQGERFELPVFIVPLVSAEAQFDQSCKYGCRVEDHAVYCYNDWWLYAPSKCRRTWHSGGKVRDEDCKGYSPRTPN